MIETRMRNKKHKFSLKREKGIFADKNGQKNKTAEKTLPKNGFIGHFL